MSHQPSHSSLAHHHPHSNTKHIMVWSLFYPRPYMNSGDSYEDTQSAWTFRNFPAPYDYKWGLYPYPLFPDVVFPCFICKTSGPTTMFHQILNHDMSWLFFFNFTIEYYYIVWCLVGLSVVGWTGMVTVEVEVEWDLTEDPACWLGLLEALSWSEGVEKSKKSFDGDCTFCGVGRGWVTTSSNGNGEHPRIWI